MVGGVGVVGGVGGDEDIIENNELTMMQIYDWMRWRSMDIGYIYYITGGYKWDGWVWIHWFTYGCWEWAPRAGFSSPGERSRD